MKIKLNVVLECFSITPVLEDTRKFQWLEISSSSSQQSLIEIGNGVELIMINMKKIKLPLDTLNIIQPTNTGNLQYPITYPDFLTFASKLAISMSNSSSWIKQMQYMKDYILAPLLISSKEIVIGIIILNNLILKTILKPSDILESNIYLSNLASTNKGTNNIAAPGEWKCDMLAGILAMPENQLSKRMQLYLMNSSSYIPRVVIRRMPKKITAIDNFRKNQTSTRLTD